MKVSERQYKQTEVISFRNTKGQYGGLSNMAPGFPLFVNETNIPNSEALYQACRFPLFPDIQAQIIAQKSPMDAKKISRQYTKYTRQDWEKVKFSIMRWCLQVKFIQNREKFSEVLLSTQGKEIVEFSQEDKVWAASPDGKGNLVGINALGRLLMEVRENILSKNIHFQYIEPINISAFLLFDNPISRVHPPEYILMDFEDNLEYA